MGLVTASIAMSKRLEVVTRAENGDVLTGGFDLDEIAEQNRFLKWIGVALESSAKTFPLAHGTRVRLSKTDRITNKNVTMFANTLRNRAGQVFRKFIKAKRVHLEVNGEVVDPVDPLMLDHPATILTLDETPIELDGRIVATVRAVELPDLGMAGNKEHGIIPQRSGFYLLRNSREIIANETFDFYRRHPNVAHFRAEISFDGSADDIFRPDVKKGRLVPIQAVVDKLRGLTQQLITQSVRQAKARSDQSKGRLDHSIAESTIPRRAQLIPKPKQLLLDSS